MAELKIDGFNEWGQRDHNEALKDGGQEAYDEMSVKGGVKVGHLSG